MSERKRIEDVWNLRARHLVPGLPDKYVFHLTCCYQDECIHPLCKDGRPAVEPTWYPGGPPLSFTPLPVPDPKRPYGNLACKECSGFCSGHYMVPEELFAGHADKTIEAVQPPTEVLKELFNRRDTEIAAADVLLPQNEVSMWLQHLRTVQDNRKRGASKAAKTRRERRLNKKTENQNTEVCQICKSEDPDNAQEQVLWIQCDTCDMWYHQVCVRASWPPLLCPAEDDIFWHCLFCVAVNTM